MVMFSARPSRPAALRMNWPVVVAVTVAITTSACSAVQGLSAAESKYLDAVHNPCQHPEIYSNVRDGQGSYCKFNWSGDDEAQVSEGHEVCAIEKRNPAAIYEAPYSYLQSQHPGYSRIQINTQMIAAEHTLCHG